MQYIFSLTSNNLLTSVKQVMVGWDVKGLLWSEYNLLENNKYYLVVQFWPVLYETKIF